MKHIAIIGVGGVGGYFGGKLTTILENHRDLNIHFIARGKHLEKIKEDGLYLQTQNEGAFHCIPSSVSDRIEDLPPLDICLLAVKAYDLEPVLLRVKDKMKESTVIIPLLNGVDIPQRIRKVIKKGIVYPSCVYVGTRIQSPGVVTQKGGSCKILFGKDEQHPEERPDAFMTLMDEAGINYEWQEQCKVSIWQKYMFIAAYGMVTACTGKTLGEVYRDETLRQVTLGAILEIAEIARREAVGIKDEMIKEALDKANTFPYETKTSFQRDYEKGGKDERMIFGMAMIHLAEKHQVSIPVIRKLDAGVQMKPLID